MFLKQYPITLKALLFTLSLLLAAMSASLWIMARYDAEYRQKHEQLARQSVRAVASEIHILLESIRGTTRLFVEDHQQLLLDWSREPDDPVIHARIKTLLSHHFPEHYAFSLADLDGEPFREDFGETIGELCLSNIRDMGRAGHPQSLVVHPGPGAYHFDIMAPWSYRGSPMGIFFKSYRLSILSNLLRLGKAESQRLMLVRQSEPDLIEVTELGGRDAIADGRSIRLSTQEMQLIGASELIRNSDWKLVTLYDENLFQGHHREFLFPAMASWLALSLLGLIALILINKEERRRQSAEARLTESNDQLESRVKKRTKALKRLNEQLESEIERRDKAESTQRILQRATDQSNEIFFITDPDSIFLYVNPQFSRSLGYEAAEVIGQHSRILKSGLMEPVFYQALWKTVSAKRPFSGIFINRTRTGEIRYMDETITPILDDAGNTEYYIANCLDVTQDTENRERIRYISEHDPLTGLYNRDYVREYVNQHIAELQDSYQFSLIYISVRRFEQLFEGLGQRLGNLLIKAVGKRLQGLVGDSCLLARAGTDEFLLIVREATNADEVVPVVLRLLSAFKKPMQVDGEDIIVTLNIGIAIYPQDAASYDDVMHCAYSALNRCKQESVDSYCLYRHGQAEKAAQWLMMERDIRTAMSEKRFQFYYQPKVSLQDGRLTGFEALCRWQERTTGQFISPEMFIPLVEEVGLIGELFKQAIRDAEIAVSREIRPLVMDTRVAINLSARQFRQPRLLEELENLWHELGLAPGDFEFEVTENALIDNVEDAARILHQLHERGCHISLDDFGTGYSSMQYLKTLPFDHLKIDKSFVMHMHEQEQDRTFVRSIIAMAHGLDMQVIAEGVEKRQHWDLLRSFGCDMAQGYFIGRPIPRDQLGEWISAYAAGVRDEVMSQA